MSSSWATALNDTVVGLPLQPIIPPIADRAELHVRWLSEWTGLPWFASRSDRGDWLSVSTRELPPLPLLSPPPAIKGLTLQPLQESLLAYALDPAVMQAPDLWLGGYVFIDERCPLRDWLKLASCSGWTEQQLREAWHRIPVCNATVLERLLRNTIHQREALQQTQTLQKRQVRLQSSVDFLTQELKLYQQLIVQLSAWPSVSRLAEETLYQLSTLLPADAFLVCLTGRDQPTLYFQGDPRFREPDLVQALVDFLNQKSPTHPLITRVPAWKHVAGADLIKHCIGVPLKRRQGWLIVCNHHAPVLLPAHAEMLRSLADVLTVPLKQEQLQSANEELAIGMVHSLVSTLDAKDPYTRGHSERVARIARRLGEELGLPTRDLDDLYLAGLLHDIGKIGVSDQILQKIEPLTADEFAEIKKHPVIGYELLSPVRRLQPILPGVRHHHEAWNGRGYPDRLAGEDIPLMARIIAVADSFDAMISDRPYRPGIPCQRVEAIFVRGADQQWDGRVLDAYFKARTDILELLEQGEQEAEFSVPAWELSDTSDIESELVLTSSHARLKRPEHARLQ